jgi:hypothetical protein
MTEIVYVLCSLTSAICAVLLGRSYLRTRVRLLFWSAFCFFALTLNSVMVFIDLVVVPEIDLRLVRSVFAMIGLACLLFALIWDARS